LPNSKICPDLNSTIAVAIVIIFHYTLRKL